MSRASGAWARDYPLDTIEENAAINGGRLWPTAASLADMLRGPRGLVDDLVAELLDLNRLREVPQTLGLAVRGAAFAQGAKAALGRPPAQKRTKPLFSDVKPPGARRGGEASEP